MQITSSTKQSSSMGGDVDFGEGVQTLALGKSAHGWTERMADFRRGFERKREDGVLVFLVFVGVLGFGDQLQFGQGNVASTAHQCIGYSVSGK